MNDDDRTDVTTKPQSAKPIRIRHITSVGGAVTCLTSCCFSTFIGSSRSSSPAVLIATRPDGIVFLNPHSGSLRYHCFGEIVDGRVPTGCLCASSGISENFSAASVVVVAWTIREAVVVRHFPATGISETLFVLSGGGGGSIWKCHLGRCRRSNAEMGGGEEDSWVLTIAHSSCRILSYSFSSAQLFHDARSADIKVPVASAIRYNPPHVISFCLSASLFDDGDILGCACGTFRSGILLWSPELPKRHHLLECPTSAFAIEVSSSSSTIVAACEDRTVRIYDRMWRKGEFSWRDIFHSVERDVYGPPRVLFGHSARVWDVSILSDSNSDGVVVGSCGEDGTLRVWERSGDVYWTRAGHGRARGTGRGGVRCITTWGEEGMVATGGDDGTIMLWNVGKVTDMCIGNDNENENGTESVHQLPLLKDGKKNKIMSNDKYVDKTKDNGDPASLTGSASAITLSLKKKKKKSCANPSYTIVGFDFLAQDSIVVATSCGLLHILLPTKKIWTTSSWGSGVERGTCLAARPSSRTVAIGTEEGNVWISEVDSSSSPPLCLSGTFGHGKIGGISWSSQTDLVAFRVAGTVEWWRFQSNGTRQFLHATVCLQGPRGSVSICATSNADILCVGDSRGNISVFSSNILEEFSKGPVRPPAACVRGVHGREHVACILFINGGQTLLSVGYDGRISECHVDIVRSNKEILVNVSKGITLTVPSVASLVRVWTISHGRERRILVAGFRGNSFVLLDHTVGYEWFQAETGGRQRRHQFLIQLGENSEKSENTLCLPNSVSVAYCLSKKHDIDKICARTVSLGGGFYKKIDCSYLPHFHGEVVSDLACFSQQGNLLVLSGSNDGTVQLCSIDLNTKNNDIRCVRDLPPHPSGVRAVCTSYQDGHTLLVTAGGKLSVNFYLLTTTPCSFCEYLTSDDIHLRPLCTLRKRPSEDEMDHRMNTVGARSLGSDLHLCIGGDSDGRLHILVVSTNEQNSTVDSVLLYSHPRPWLCVKILCLQESSLIVAGNTGGDIFIWIIYTKDIVEDEYGQWKFCGNIDQFTPPLYVYKAHQVGTNHLDAHCIHEEACLFLRVVSGGDDQSLALMECEITLQNGLLVMKRDAVSTVLNAHRAAVKAVGFGGASSLLHVYSVGCDRRFKIWEAKLRSTDTFPVERSIVEVGTFSTHVADVQRLDIINLQKLGRKTVVICGIGMEVMEIK